MHAILEHLVSMGATLAGQNTITEVQEVENQHGISLPLEFHDYLTSFRSCEFSKGPMWNFFSLGDCVDRTLIYRRHYRYLRGPKFKIPIDHIFAFCDALIDCPTYFVVAHKESSHYGTIVGAHGDKGWIVGKGLDDFLSAFKHDFSDAILSNENHGA